MANVDMSYDDPAYRARLISGTEAGGAATTQYGKFANFAAARIRSVQYTVTVQGTAAAHAFSLLKISGATTSTLITTTLGTAAVGTTTNADVTAVAAATAVAGDVIAVISASDATGKAVTGVEVQLQAGATLRA